MGQEMLTLSGTPDFTPIAVHDFTHSLYITDLSVLGLCLRINDWLFAWIRTMFTD